MGFLYLTVISVSLHLLDVPLCTVSATPEQPLSKHKLTATPIDIITQYLIPHNELRASLGLPPFLWSERLADYAAWWAQQRIWDCQLIHSDSDYGENIFWGSGDGWRPADAVASWAEERFYYNYFWNACMFGRDCLHYTQMIWRDSHEVGCAQVRCANGDTFIGCNYYPHGNIIGERPF